VSAPTLYTIRITGRLGPSWADWFSGLELVDLPDGTLLRGVLPDQAALLQVLNQLQALNLALIAVERCNEHSIECSVESSSPLDTSDQIG
jgi:hypothetical protein